jgi:hypothetical protein
MTKSINGPRVPGATLRKLARMLFTEHLVSVVVEPAIADLNYELVQAGPSRFRRLRAQWRGYLGLCMVMLVAPFASVEPASSDQRVIALSDAVSYLSSGIVVVALAAVAGFALGGSAAVIVAAATLLASVLHGWHQHHPSDVPAPLEAKGGLPQINFSSTKVAGNAGGLIFAIGSVVIVSIGVPSLISFLLFGIVAGCVVAWALAVWHSNHPTSGRSQNRIALR